MMIPVRLLAIFNRVILFVCLWEVSHSFSFPTAPTTNANNHRNLESETEDEPPHPPHLIFPGGGIYFYWQAGVVCFLRENNYNLDQTIFTGASAGALTATLSATDVDFYEATDKALSMAKLAGVWDRRGGLQGVWGEMISDWLDDLLPEDAVERTNERVSLLLTPLPSFGKERVSSFRDRQDLIRCNLASVHLPWFLDSKLTAQFRGQAYIDGSFLAGPNDYHSQNKSFSRSIVIDHKKDPKYRSQSLTSFIEAVSPDGIHEMLEDGKRFARQMEKVGAFQCLKKSD
jgi:hypothetical protein